MSDSSSTVSPPPGPQPPLITQIVAPPPKLLDADFPSPPPKLSPSPQWNPAEERPPIEGIDWDTEDLGSAVEFNVLNYGAEGDGTTNDTEAFLDAWTAACAVDTGYVHASAGYTFLVYPIIFKGPCKTNMTFKVDGTIIAPSDPSVWDDYGKYWLQFKSVTMTIQGKGTIDGRGQTWWANSCKTNKSNPCVDGPTALVINTCTNVTIKNVAIQNSQQMHVAFEKSTGITVNNVTITAPGTSPNTDGIHLQNSSSVTIKNTQIATGDDCISIQTGSFNVNIKNFQCLLGHGISVGGLGKSQTRAEVSGLVVDTAVFHNATNGVRIKTWQGSSGYANNFCFKNIQMINTKNPILIDQYYCDSGASGSCTNYTSNVLVSDIKYKNITGTSASATAVSFHCSETTVACTDISLDDINLVQTSGSSTTSSCDDAYGTASGTEAPPSCLLDS
ncbi:unnamed protein product [Calypogeia fissa]